MIVYEATVYCDDDDCKASVKTRVQVSGNYGGGRHGLTSGGSVYHENKCIPEGPLKGWCYEERSYQNRQIHFLYCPEHNSNSRAKASEAERSGSSRATSVSVRVSSRVILGTVSPSRNVLGKSGPQYEIFHDGMAVGVSDNPDGAGMIPMTPAIRAKIDA